MLDNQDHLALKNMELRAKNMELKAENIFLKSKITELEGKLTLALMDNKAYAMDIIKRSR